MDTYLCIRELISHTTNINTICKSTTLLYKLKPELKKKCLHVETHGVFETHRVSDMMLDMADWMQKSRHYLSLPFPELLCLLLLVSPLICLWRSNTRAWRHQLGVS